jgi:hypothetical protein
MATAYKKRRWLKNQFRKPATTCKHQTAILAHMWRLRQHRKAASRHTFIFITQSSRSWNKFSYIKARNRLESPTFSQLDRMHGSRHSALIVVGHFFCLLARLKLHISFPRLTRLAFYCHETINFIFELVQCQKNELLQPLRYFFMRWLCCALINSPQRKNNFFSAS